jgi:hypothetical protein
MKRYEKSDVTIEVVRDRIQFEREYVGGGDAYDQRAAEDAWVSRLTAEIEGAGYRADVALNGGANHYRRDVYARVAYAPRFWRGALKNGRATTYEPGFAAWLQREQAADDAFDRAAAEADIRRLCAEALAFAETLAI